MPGSHLWPELSEDKAEVESIAATGPAGTMLMFDGRLWYGTGANRTSRRRHLLLGLLGFRTYGTLGNVNGVIRPNRSLIRRGEQVGPMEGTPAPEQGAALRRAPSAWSRPG